jgi:hypothetical protein
MDSVGSASSSLDATAATNDYQTPASDKVKRTRKTLPEMAELHIAELETLKMIDTTGWSDKRRETHETKIEELVARVEADKK